VRQRLLNLANENRQDFGMPLTKFAPGTFPLSPERLSAPRSRFVLKGALLLQLWTSEVYRPIRDLDLLGEGPAKGYCEVFADVCGDKVEDDGVTFLADTIRIQKIRDEEAYEGVRLLLEARLANARIPPQIDVGFGDASHLRRLRSNIPLQCFQRKRPPAVNSDAVTAGLPHKENEALQGKVWRRHHDLSRPILELTDLMAGYFLELDLQDSRLCPFAFTPNLTAPMTV
jgi:hypothetical protein